MKTTMQIEGMDSLLNLFRQLPPNVAGKLVKPAMQEAGKLLQGQLRTNAIKQLAGATSRGYKRKSGTHLSATTGTRVKMYNKGGTTFVAVGFQAREGGYHGHLVELGHRIVKGGTLEKKSQLPGITAAGRRWLAEHSLVKGFIPKVALHGKKGRMRKDKGSIGYQYTGKRQWLGMKPGEWFKLQQRSVFGRQIRGGGKATGGRTKPYPMLGPAFQTMQRPMLITIENELKKIEGEAIRLSMNFRGGARWGSGKSSAN